MRAFRILLLKRGVGKRNILPLRNFKRQLKII
nr:MAG TPA: hypothetical protein [Caudoviricetes sp.]